MERTTDLHGNTGERCSECDCPYDECSKRIFVEEKGACCGRCYSTDTHNEVRTPRPRAPFAIREATRKKLHEMDPVAVESKRQIHVWDDEEQCTIVLRRSTACTSVGGAPHWVEAARIKPMTNEQIAETILSMLDLDDPLDDVVVVAAWSDEEWTQVDIEPHARRLTLEDRLEIVATLATKMRAQVSLRTSGRV